MYHVVGTGLTAFLLYIISYIFCRLRYISLQFHKKFWNILLAISFLLTVAAGIFMALQVTYKWDLPFVKTILKWHVEFGIGLAFTGIFHFLWHLSYFGKLFGRSGPASFKATGQKISASEISINLFITGLVSSSVQLLLLREMLNISGGYELITGIFLGSWLISSSAGALFAGSSPVTDLRKISLVFSLSPLSALFMMLFLSRFFLNTGETPSFLVSLIYTFLVLIPYCLVSGFTFVKLISIARGTNDFPPGKSFSVETLGGVTAGILISILTSGLLNTWQLILLTILLSTGYVVLTYYLKSRMAKTSCRIAVVVLSAFIIFYNPDIFFRQILLSGINVTGSDDTPYGNITYGEYKGEQSTYYNQRLLAYNDDVIEREENIHYAMLQSDSPGKVILISGPLKPGFTEILKYPVKKVIYIERDPALTGKELIPADRGNAELKIVNSDAFRYIKRSSEIVDVIILSIPPPSTLQLSRYYTTEFFQAVKKDLNAGGVFMCSPGQGSDYYNKESLKLYSSIYNSLSEVFKNVKPVAGNKLYFAASDKELSTAYCQLAVKRNISNIYVGPDYLSDDIITRKSNEITELMDRGIRQNRSSFPVASFHFQSYNFSRDLNEKIPSVIILVLVFAAPLLAIRRRHIMMYFSASALAGLEIIILLTLQIIIGNMYQLSGLVIAGLMAGLSLGASGKLKVLSSLSLRNKCIFLLLFYAGLGLVFDNLLQIKYDLPALVMIMLSAFLPAVITGDLFNEFTLSNDEFSSAPAVYSADLTGSAFGFIVMSGIAIPNLGIKASIFLLSALIFTGILFGTARNKL